MERLGKTRLHLEAEPDVVVSGLCRCSTFCLADLALT